jgi:hypothetical protein
MKKDGKQLEGLVSFVEKTLLPKGFDVKTNERVYNDEGIQIAEFDIEIRGESGSTNIAWLIECRDRPSQGPAPGSWIEQLVGRRIRFGFNRVTAVSTTGFAEGVVEFAQKERIELREVKAIKPEEFSNWLVMRHFSFIEHLTKLEFATVFVKEGESEDRCEALSHLISGLSRDAKYLLSLKSGDIVSADEAFLSAVSGVGYLFNDLKPNCPGKRIRLQAQYTEADHFVVDTKLGPIHIAEILFMGELFIHETLIPLTMTAEYRQAKTGEPISQVAIFDSQMIHGIMFSPEMHHFSESGETHIGLRVLSSNAKTAATATGRKRNRRTGERKGDRLEWR